MMSHALKVNPTNPSWLRTQADIYYGNEVLLFSVETLTKLDHAYS